MLRELFCKHEYEIIHDETSRLFENSWDQRPIEVYRNITQVCKKCGKIKYKKIRLSNGS